MLPKLSYILTSYNRKDYIRDALMSAFKQDYEGELEIIISDDCSTDGTYEIIQEMVSEYHGCHKIIVTQTPKNSGLAGNTNHALKLVSSDWMIRADDDDLAASDRCSIIGQAIMRFPNATCFAHPYKQVCSRDKALNYVFEKTRENPEYSIQQLPDLSKQEYFGFNHSGFLGQAWSMKMYQIFGPLPIKANYLDDFITYIRSLVLGFKVIIHTTPKVVVYHSNNNNSGILIKKPTYLLLKQRELFLEKCFKYSNHAYNELRDEINCFFENKELSSDTRALVDFVNKEADLCDFRNQLWNRNNAFHTRMSAIRKIQALNGFSFYLLLKILPLPVFLSLSYAGKLLKRLFK